MKLKRGKLLLGNEDKMVFKNKMATLICLDGLIYIVNDDILQKSAEEIDKLDPLRAKNRACALFGNAHSVRVGKKNKLYIGDAPDVVSLFDCEFEIFGIDDGICAIIPEGKSASDIHFFEKYLKD